MLNGYQLLMRRQTRLARDYGTAYEVFVGQPYNVSVPDVRTIVDLGANVGYSALYFAIRHRLATIYAFGPHPAHFSGAKKLISANSLGGRITLIHAAAGLIAVRFCFPTTIPARRSWMRAAMAVPAVDLFSWCRTIGKIDLLKIDIDGDEYALLSDPRFRDLDCENIVEWHSTPEKEDAAGWCRTALRAAGYAPMVESSVPEKSDAGIIHALKSSATHRRAHHEPR